MKRASLILFMSFAMAFLPDLLGLFATSFSDDSKFLGSLERYSQECDISTESSKCYKKYQIPVRDVETRSSDSYLGFGFFAVVPVVYCGQQYGSASDLRPRGNLNIIDSFKVYKSFKISTLHCSLDDNLIVEVWAPKNYSKVGQMGSSAIVAPERVIESLKRMVEAVSGAFYLVVALALGLALLINFFIFGRISNMSKMESFGNYTMWVIALCIIFSIFKSGVLDLFVAPGVNTEILFRSQDLVSALLHILILFSFRSQETSKRILTVIEWALKIFALSILFAPHFENFFLSGLGVIWLAVFLAVVKGSDKKNMVVYSLVFGVEYLKCWEHAYLPTGMTTIYFVLFIVSIDMAGRLSLAGKYVWLLETQAVKISANSDLGKSIDLLRMFQILQAQRVSLVKLNKEGSGEVITLDFNGGIIQRREAVFEHLPPMLAHVATVKKDFSVEPIETFVGSTLLKEVKADLGDFFSIYQIVLNSELSGFICISKYIVPPMMEHEKAMHNFASNVLIEKFKDYYEISRNVKIGRWVAEASRIQELFNNSEAMHSEIFYDSICEKIGNTFGFEAAFGRFDRKTGMLEFLGSNIKNMKMKYVFFADKWNLSDSNLSGPASIALHMNEVVVVQNTALIFGVITERTKMIFLEGGIKGIAAIPIVANGSDGNEDYLLWLQSKNENEIDESLRPGLTIVSSAIATQLKLKSQSIITNELMAGVYRSDIKEKFIAGEMPSEIKNGFLVMVDIIGSTKLVSLIGAKKWNDIIHSVGHVLNAQVSSNFGSKLEITIWDAFFVYMNNSEDQWGNAVNLGVLTRKIITSELDKRFKNEGLESQIKTRVCIVWGDCSTRFGEKGWEIIGSAMASAMKTETALKGLYCDFVVAVNSPPNEMLITIPGLKDPVRNVQVYEISDSKNHLKKSA